MAHHRLARRLGVAGDNRLHDGLVLFGQAGKHRRHLIHALAALLNGGVQQVEKAAHGLQEHHVMRGFGDRQVKADIRLRGDIRVFTLGRFKAQTNFFFIGVGGAHRRVPRGAGFDGVAGFEDIEAVVRVIGQQRLQRLDDVLL